MCGAWSTLRAGSSLLTKVNNLDLGVANTAVAAREPFPKACGPSSQPQEEESSPLRAFEPALDGASRGRFSRFAGEPNGEPTVADTGRCLATSTWDPCRSAAH